MENIKEHIDQKFEQAGKRNGVIGALEYLKDALILSDAQTKQQVSRRRGAGFFVDDLRQIEKESFSCSLFGLHKKVVLNYIQENKLAEDGESAEQIFKYVSENALYYPSLWGFRDLAFTLQKTSTLEGWEFYWLLTGKSPAEFRLPRDSVEYNPLQGNLS
ncbi:MAG: hypothetical protein WC533_01515 [Candidatus Pacearchaeota archaeon]